MKRNTHQQKAVSDTLYQLKGRHPSADTVYDEVKKSMQFISKATVYRILNQMAEENIIQKVRLMSSADRYDICTDRHYHMVCNGCGTVYDIETEPLTGLCDRAIQSDSYEITGYELVFTGECLVCKNNKSK